MSIRDVVNMFCLKIWQINSNYIEAYAQEGCVAKITEKILRKENCKRNQIN